MSIEYDYWPDEDAITAAENVLATYVLQLIGPQDELAALTLKSTVRWREYLRETEENLTDLLPDGYEVRIKEWDHE